MQKKLMIGGMVMSFLKQIKYLPVQLDYINLFISAIDLCREFSGIKGAEICLILFSVKISRLISKKKIKISWFVLETDGKYLNILADFFILDTKINKNELEKVEIHY